MHPPGERGAYGSYIGSTIIWWGYEKPDINKRIKAFDNKISARIANNKIIADAEYPTEIWQLDYGNLGNTHLIYNPEANIWEEDEYTEEALKNTSQH